MDLAEALENLSRHGPAEAQQKAIAWLTSREDYDLHLLIQTDGKSHLENAAKVLRQKGAAKKSIIFWNGYRISTGRTHKTSWRF